ncbi:MAG: dihydroorotate dehydrogenase electron transfer subunit [Clostridia bacterium]|nr:dihydroorotate dehydrogenase electron transfer subunit [Clostridia bacterium]
MKYIQDDFKIAQVNKLTENIVEFYIDCPLVADVATSGQFVHILCGDLTLRRPISICEILKEKGQLRIVFEIKGKGTQWLAERREGDVINMLAPIGRGFNITPDKKAVIIGGGIGVIPMLDVAKNCSADACAILGFRNKQAVILEEDYKNAGVSVEITTDDGSYGKHGFVTDVLKDYIKNQKIDVIYACGPTPMLKAVSAIANESDIECYVSLEERMGCGIGACLACACKTKDANGEHYKHVCKDGPVFNSKEIEF